MNKHQWADGSEMIVGQIVHDGGLDKPSSITEITDEGFYAGELFFSWEDPSYGRRAIWDSV